MDIKEIQELVKYDDFVIIERKKGWFIKFNDQLPAELKDKITSDNFSKLVKKYNLGFKMADLSIIFALSIVLLPVAIYTFYKKIEIFTLLWYKGEADYRSNQSKFEVLDASRKKATLIFKFKNNNNNNNNDNNKTIITIK